MRDHLLGFPAIAEHGAEAEEEAARFALGWTSGSWCDPYPLGVPRRVRNEWRTCVEKLEAADPKQPELDAFRSGNHANPDGTLDPMPGAEPTSGLISCTWAYYRPRVMQLHPAARAAMAEAIAAYKQQREAMTPTPAESNALAQAWNRDRAAQLRANDRARCLAASQARYMVSQLPAPPEGVIQKAEYTMKELACVSPV